MDKFDDMIKQSQTHYEPRNNFVENTMELINAKAPKSHRRFIVWMSAAGTLAVLAIVFVALPFGKNMHNTSNNGNTTASNVGQASNTAPSQAASLPAGTDDASLASDLASIQSSQTQENTDQTSANNTLNDSAQQVTIPTN